MSVTGASSNRSYVSTLNARTEFDIGTTAGSGVVQDGIVVDAQDAGDWSWVQPVQAGHQCRELCRNIAEQPSTRGRVEIASVGASMRDPLSGAGSRRAHSAILCRMRCHADDVGACRT
jgi:hypothetical protein